MSISPSKWCMAVPVYRLRGRLLPLVYLNRELKLKEKLDSAGSSDARSQHRGAAGR
jgi:hypothetical protein